MTLIPTVRRLGAKLQAITKISVLLCIVTTSALIFGGCVIGPKYEYARQVDSASMEGPIVPKQGPENGSCYVEIVRIDGLGANFTTSRPGVNWPLYDSNNRLYFAPGKHTLVLSIGEIDETYGNIGGGAVGEVGAFTAGATPTITMDLMAGHVYRLGADLEGSAIEITLWDETKGAATPSSAATWTVDSGGVYMQATPK